MAPTLHVLYDTDIPRYQIQTKTGNISMMISYHTPMKITNLSLASCLKNWRQLDYHNAFIKKIFYLEVTSQKTFSKQ